MATSRYKVLAEEKDGVDFAYPEELDLKAPNIFFDNVAAPNFLADSVQAAIVEARGLASTQVLANSTLVMTSASNRDQFFTGTTVGQIVKLPDATTRTPGDAYAFYNQGSVSIALQDASGAALMTLSQTSIAYFKLQLNSTAAGAWVGWQILTSATGILNYNVVAMTPFVTASATDVQITGFSVIPVAGTYIVSFSANGALTGSGADTTATIYMGILPVTDSPRTVTSGGGSHKITATSQTVAQWDGVKAATIYVSTSGSLTITGRSLSMIRLGP